MSDNLEIRVFWINGTPIEAETLYIGNNPIFRFKQNGLCDIIISDGQTLTNCMSKTRFQPWRLEEHHLASVGPSPRNMKSLYKRLQIVCGFDKELRAFFDNGAVPVNTFTLTNPLLRKQSAPTDYNEMFEPLV